MSHAFFDRVDPIKIAGFYHYVLRGTDVVVVPDVPTGEPRSIGTVEEVRERLLARDARNRLGEAT